MSTDELIGFGGLPLAVPGRRSLLKRPAELAELVEHTFRSIFLVGVVLAAAFAVVEEGMLIAYRDELRYHAAAAAFIAGVIALAIANRRVYGLLRRHPSAALLIAVGCGASAWHTDRAGYLLDVPIMILIGITGCAVALRVVFVESIVVAIGMTVHTIIVRFPPSQAAPTVTALLFIPALCFLLVEMLARFVSRLHQAAEASIPSRPPVWIDGAFVDRPQTRSQAAAAPDAEVAPLIEEPLRTAKRLSPRQLQVVALACEGLRAAEIAECLEVSVDHVDRLLATARARVGVATTAALVAWAIRERFVPPAAS